MAPRTALKPIRVQLRLPTSAGRLYSRYDPESNILVMESRIPRPWPVGINVAGAMVLDFDAEAVLANVDMHIGKRLWQPQSSLALPAPHVVADIVATTESIAAKVFDPTIRALCTIDRSACLTLFSDEPADRSVELSSSCVALLAEDRLVGFYSSMV